MKRYNNWVATDVRKSRPTATWLLDRVRKMLAEAKLSAEDGDEIKVTVTITTPSSRTSKERNGKLQVADVAVQSSDSSDAD